MDDVSVAIGQLTATVAALSRRADELHAENITRHTEVITRMTDTQAQLHEVKHASNNHDMTMIALTAKFDGLTRELRRLSQPYDAMLSLRSITIGLAAVGTAVAALITVGHMLWVWVGAKLG